MDVTATLSSGDKSVARLIVPVSWASVRAGMTSLIQSPADVSSFPAATSILPDKAWLTRLKVSEKQVDLEGFANSATELIPKLEASKYLSRAELASATSRDQRTNLDRFVIKAEIEGAKKGEIIRENKSGEAAHEKK